MLSRSAIKTRALALLKALKTSKGARQKIILNDINDLASQYPMSSDVFRKRINDFIFLAGNQDEQLRSKSRQALALIGYSEPPKSPGIRVLAIDGGGTRGLVSIEILRHLERKTRKRIHELFDLICGVSSGAIITMAVGSAKFTLDQCESFYRDMSEDIFKTDFWAGTPRLLLNHAYYDAAVFEKTLKNAFGNTTLMNVAANPDVPRLNAVSVNAHTVQPYLFRTYALSPTISGRFDGTCKAELWQAIRASSAAPGYFEEFKFGPSILLDGGMLVNNCTGVATVEASLLWANEPIQCVVSVGSGKFKHNDVLKTTGTSLYEKAHGLVYSATDTETIHVILQNLIKNHFRFNPQLSENIIISENRKMKLDQLKAEAKQYMLDNEMMLDRVSKLLVQPRQLYRRFIDYCWPNHP